MVKTKESDDMIITLMSASNVVVDSGEQILSVNIDAYHCQSWSFGRKFGVGTSAEIFQDNKDRDEYLTSIVDCRNVGHGNCNFTSMLILVSFGHLNYGSRIQFTVNSLLTIFNCSYAFGVFTVVNHVAMAMHLHSIFGEVNEALNVFKNITERDFIGD